MIGTKVHLLEVGVVSKCASVLYELIVVASLLIEVLSYHLRVLVHDGYTSQS